MRSIFKGALVSGALIAFSAGVVSAQQCTETEFSSATGQLYLEAENALLQEDNPAAALDALNRLRAMELNCYEEGAAIRLSAAVKVETGDFLGAARDIEAAMSRGYIPADQLANTLYQLSQIYLQAEDEQRALDYMLRWANSPGISPDRNQKWQLAVLLQRAGRNEDALGYAEDVLESDGPNARQEVYDFLLYLYHETGNFAKKAQLLEVLVTRDPTNRKYWDAIAGEYFRGGEDRRAFEVQKAMYLAGLLQTEDEIMRVVNFYNTFDVPYAAAKILEKEMNAGRVETTFQRLELLANLYQVAREHQKAIPVLERAAAMRNSGQIYERIGRSYADLQQWEETEEALTKALDAGDLKDRGLAWVLIGQSRYERGDRQGAIQAFRNANNRGGRGWLQFMESERATAKALACFDVQSRYLEIENEQRVCRQLSSFRQEQLPEGCLTVADRLETAQAELEAQGCEQSS